MAGTSEKVEVDKLRLGKILDLYFPNSISAKASILHWFNMYVCVFNKRKSEILSQLTVTAVTNLLPSHCAHSHYFHFREKQGIKIE